MGENTSEVIEEIVSERPHKRSRTPRSHKYYHEEENSNSDKLHLVITASICILSITFAMYNVIYFNLEKTLAFIYVVSVTTLSFSGTFKINS